MRLMICVVVIVLFSTSVFAGKGSYIDHHLSRMPNAKPVLSTLKGSKLKTPIRITTTQGLVKYFGKKQAKAIGAKINLKRQFILLFARRGSGKDQLNYTTHKSNPPQYSFSHSPGRTRDVKQHANVYVVGLKAKWKGP